MNQTKRIADRVVAWALETLGEAVGTSAILGVLATFADIEAHNRFLVIVQSLAITPAVLLYFGITGYLFTTAYAALMWRDKGRWFYPSTAALLYVSHSQILFWAGGFHHPSMEHVFISGCGACLTFTCCLAGNRLIIARSGEI